MGYLAEEGNVASEFEVNEAGTKGSFRLAIEVGSGEYRKSLFIGVTVLGEYMIKRVQSNMKVGNRVAVVGRLDGYKSEKTFYKNAAGEFVPGVDIFTITANDVNFSPRFHDVVQTKLEKGAAAAAPVAAPAVTPAVAAQPAAAPAAPAPVAAAPAAVAQPVAVAAGYGDDDF